MEALIIKTMLDHTGEVFGNDLPYRSLKKYIDVLFSEEEREIVWKTAVHFANDSFYTTTSLLHTSSEVALACLLLASKQLGKPTPLNDDYNFERLAERLNHWIKGDGKEQASKPMEALVNSNKTISAVGFYIEDLGQSLKGKEPVVGD